MRILLLKHGECKKLAEKFKCSQQTISYALNFRKHSWQDRTIRHYAANELQSIIKT